MKQTTLAKKFWNNLPSQTKIKILNNVWCGGCQASTSIAVEMMSIKGGDLLLEGKCTKCNGRVARLIEGG